jgi:DNA-binding FrmR family transcriptional regulator
MKKELQKDIHSRISKIKGQIEGIDKMLEQERNCLDIVQQISAVDSALKKISMKLLQEEISTCTKDSAKVEKTLNTIFKLN